MGRGVTVYRPTFQREGPASPCDLHGQDLKWKNCTPLSGAMALDSATLGKTVISGCQLRDETGDYAGGVTLPQVAAVIEAHGVKVELHVGANVCSPEYAAAQLRLHRPIILQGNTQPDGRGNVNHAIEVNDVWGGTTVGHPAYAAVADPWSTGIAAWPWWKVETFAAALRPYGEQDVRLLGPGKFYAGILPPPPTLWGSDVSAGIRSADRTGNRTAAVFRKARASYGAVVNVPDLVRMFKHFKVHYGTVIEAKDMVALFKAAGV